jgi:hypothetical protein
MHSSPKETEPERNKIQIKSFQVDCKVNTFLQRKEGVTKLTGRCNQRLANEIEPE